jgi:hypothetical protein
MRGLHQDRSRASEQDRNLAMHLPADALRPEVAEIAVRGHAATVSAVAGKEAVGGVWTSDGRVRKNPLPE